MRVVSHLLMLVLVGVATGVAQHAADSSLLVKALTRSEIDGLLSGEGMGMAKVMELNHYPGPRHLLDLSEQIGLTEAQIRQAQAAFDTMHARAVELGRQVVRFEARLDSLCSTQKVDDRTFQEVEKLTLKIAALRGKLRLIHMRAHVKMRKVLSLEQIAAYDRLRGHPTE